MRLKDLIIPGVLVMIPVALIVKQPDLGSGILVTMVAASMILFVGVQWRTPHGVRLHPDHAVPGDLAFPQGSQRQRVLTFLNPEKDP